MIIPTPEQFTLHYNLDHPTLNKIPTFRYYDLPAMGVGRDSQIFMQMDEHFDTSNFAAIWAEIQENFDVIKQYTKRIVVNGIVPTSHNDGVKSIDSMLLNPQKYIDFEYADDIKHLTTLSTIKSYFYQKFGMNEAWNGVCHLRDFTNYASRNQPSKWSEHAKHLPLLKQFVESLPFKTLGYAIFFISNGDGKNGAIIHRDTYHRAHNKSNFINIMFDQLPRPFFIYDPISRKRKYLDPNCSMYYFNECDLHGVDPEPTPRYMLRVEGVFEDWFSEKLGLVKNGEFHEAFDWSYKAPQDWINSGRFKVWEETDI
jgi:hypothetical protein